MEEVGKKLQGKYIYIYMGKTTQALRRGHPVSRREASLNDQTAIARVAPSSASRREKSSAQKW